MSAVARAAGISIFLALAACGTTQKSDWERQNETALAPTAAEQAPPLPAWPKEGDLIEFEVAATSAFRFYIDAASVSVSRDLVFYTLVARSDAGAQNISFEGMRCTAGEVRTFALGHEGAWHTTSGAWRPIEPRTVQRWHNALYREYFCPQREALPNARQAILALRRGGSSITNSLTEDVPRGASGSGW